MYIDDMQVKIHNSWRKILKEEFEKSYFTDLINFVKSEYIKGAVYPPGSKIFNAFDKCHYDKVKVVILGQDPYHGPDQANGLCFSVTDKVRIPPSLRNIYKELHSDIGKEIPTNGDLSHWAEQGVLMINATLTVKKGQAGSHQNKGWEEFTDAVVKILSDQKENLVFLLWGRYAQQKGQMIDTSKHLVLKSAHPSPFSADRGFFGNKHFSKTNQYLTSHGQKAIKW